MQHDLCSAIHESVTTFVETPEGRALAQRGRRGELHPGQFFAAACASADSPVLAHLAQSIDLLPENLEQAYLQAWAIADRTSRRFDLDWRLDDEGIASGVEVRYRLHVRGECVSLVVDAIAEAPARA